MSDPEASRLPHSAGAADDHGDAAAAPRASPLRAHAPVVKCEDIAALSHLAGSDFSLVTPRLGADGAVLRGRYLMAPLRSGLILHATDALDLHDTTTTVIHGEGLTISLFLEGSAEISFGGRPLRLGGAQAEGAMMARAEPDLFVRHGRRGVRVRKVNVSLPPSWLEGEGDAMDPGGGLRAFGRDHLACARWQPSSRLVALAAQVLAPPAFSPLLASLYVESRAMEIVIEALSALGHAERAEEAAFPRSRQRMWRVHDFIEAHLDRELSLDDIAREAGMSVNSLQRAFRAAFDTTVFDYVRRRKLERAREILAGGGLTVAQAAYAAGYNSSANFSTAFKRAFGISPKALRRRGSPAD